MATAEIHKVWADFDVSVEGKNGLVIHSSMTVRGYSPGSSPEMTIIYWFYYTDNSPIRGVLRDHTDVSGNACAAEDFAPPYKASTYDDFAIFMPYEAFGFEGVGYFEAYCNLGIYCGDKLLARKKRVLVFSLASTGGPRQFEERPREEPTTPDALPPPPKGRTGHGDIWSQLGIPRSASRKQKEQMLLQQFNTYRARINHPDLAKRQEAERMLALIARARQELQ